MVIYFPQVNIFVHFWMLDASFLCFNKAQVQFSMGFSSQKSPNPHQNSRNAEITDMDAVKYVFHYPRTSLKVMHILSPFCRQGKGVQNFIFHGYATYPCQHFNNTYVQK